MGAQLSPHADVLAVSSIGSGLQQGQFQVMANSLLYGTGTQLILSLHMCAMQNHVSGF